MALKAKADTTKRGPDKLTFMSQMKKLYDDMATLFIDGCYSDLQIVCRGASFRVHRAILFPRCEFFRVCFTSGFKEDKEGVVTLDDDDPNALRMALHYIYTRSNLVITTCFDVDESFNIQTLIATWKLADKYHLPELTQQCLMYMDTATGMEALQRRSGPKFSEELIGALVDTKGMGAENEMGKINNEMRTRIKETLLAAERPTNFSLEVEEILRSDGDVAVELLKFVLDKQKAKIVPESGSDSATLSVARPSIPPPSVSPARSESGW